MADLSGGSASQPIEFLSSDEEDYGQEQGQGISGGKEHGPGPGQEQGQKTGLGQGQGQGERKRKIPSSPVPTAAAVEQQLLNSKVL